VGPAVRRAVLAGGCARRKGRGQLVRRALEVAAWQRVQLGSGRARPRPKRACPHLQPTSTWSDGSGATLPATVKGSLWKASYHSGRAATYLESWLGAWVQQPGAACARL
jgi:hypothetical protein